MSFDEYQKKHHALFSPVTWAFLVAGAIIFYLAFCK